MKTRFTPAVLCSLGLALALPASAVSPAVPPEPTSSPTLSASDNLQFTIVMPASASSFQTDGLASELAAMVRTEFARAGFNGKLTYVSSTDAPQANVPRLELNLVAWRFMPTHAVDCMFNATWVNGSEEKDLGLFSGLALTVTGFQTPLERTNAYGEAATRAIDDLLQELTRFNIVPGDVS